MTFHRNFLPNTLTDVAIILAVAGLVTLLIVIVLRLARVITAEQQRDIIVLLVGLTLVGAVAGLSGGKSRVGVVGDIIPAALALLGAVAVHLFGVDRSKGLVASVGAAAFALSLGMGYAAGAANRQTAETHAETRAICTKAFTDPNILKDDAAYCRLISSFGQICGIAMPIYWTQLAPSHLNGREVTPDAFRSLLESEFFANAEARLRDANCSVTLLERPFHSRQAVEGQPQQY